jgi:hypothetical protein
MVQAAIRSAAGWLADNSVVTAQECSALGVPVMKGSQASKMFAGGRNG